MADNRVKSVIDAVKTTLTSLTTTGTNVFVHKDKEFQSTEVPGLNIRIGQLAPTGTPVSHFDWELQVFVDAYVRANSSYWETLLLIQAEVHAALRADHTLGISYVHDVMTRGAEEVQVDGEGEKVKAFLPIEILIHFRTSKADLTA